MEMVTLAVAQEAVSGAVSFVLSRRNEKASQEDLRERLEMAHINLDLALERSRMMPITIMPLLRLRKKLKDVFNECDDLLGKARDHQKMVPSLRRKIMHAVLPSFIVPNQDVLSSSAVARFERFAEEADKFVRDVESGCSLSRYRFHNPLIRHLLEGKGLTYRMMRGSQTWCLSIRTASLEEYGRVARLDFDYKDRKAPLKSFELYLDLSLYESTDIIGVAAKCLQSTGPEFKSLVEIAMGELTQVPTQDVSYSDSLWWEDGFDTFWIPDPFCCIASGPNKHCAKSITSSELTGRFPQEVMSVIFTCRFSASDYCPCSSTDEALMHTIKSWPPLELAIAFAPHCSLKPEEGGSLHQIEEGIQTKAVYYFIGHPELTDCDTFWNPPSHGCAIFEVLKPITKTRRAAKRRR